MDDISRYNEDMKKLVSILNAIIESEEYTMLVESHDQDNTLEYGIVGQKMESVRFDNLNGESFWEFMYKGIYSVEPNSVVNFMNVNAFGNFHSTVIIDLNERVKAIITNSDHKYDGFISRLQVIMENSEDISTKQHDEKGPILGKRMKPLD